MPELLQKTQDLVSKSEKTRGFGAPALLEAAALQLLVQYQGNVEKCLSVADLSELGVAGRPIKKVDIEQGLRKLKPNLGWDLRADKEYLLSLLVQHTSERLAEYKSSLMTQSGTHLLPKGRW